MHRAAKQDYNGLNWQLDWKDMNQGFVDNYGDFLTREQAWYLAEANDQIRNRHCGQEGMLYSENLY